METKRPTAKPDGADNAENSVKCMNCGNTILLSHMRGDSDGSVECDVCHKSQSIGADGSTLSASSNEDY